MNFIVAPKVRGVLDRSVEKSREELRESGDRHRRGDAPGDRLFVDPWLPPWLLDLTLIDLRVGKRKLDIRFWREGETTRFEVLRGDAEIVAMRSSLEFLQMLRRGPR